MKRVPASTEPLAPWCGRAIMHVDLDAFFAAAEQLDHPEWRGLPVIVGGDPKRRGVVATASYEARRFGVHSAMPSALAVQLCPDAVWAPARFERYHELSQSVFALLRDESPWVQPVSIDEAFVDVTPGRFGREHPISIARRIRRRVSEIGLTISVGLANSKTTAKIASDHDKPDGLTVVWPSEEAAFLAPLPIRAMSGIGPRTAERLLAMGIKTLGDLATLDDVSSIQLLGQHGPALVMRARGIDPASVGPSRLAKSVSNERTFAEDLRAPAEVTGALDALCAKVAGRLRAKQLRGKTVTVKLRFADFSTRTVRKTLERVTDDDAVFGPVAFDLVREAWTAGVGLRLLGVGISGFDDDVRQLDLLGDADTVKDEERADLVAGIDAVRERFGADALRFGNQIPLSDSGDVE